MKRFGIVNVLDLELTCYENQQFPEGEKPEIIEIGLCSVDLRTLQIIKAVSLPVIPVRSTVSPYCTELTGWTYEELKRTGMTFAEACRRMHLKHATSSRLLVTDSVGDVIKIQTQCSDMSVDCPIGADHLNVSTMFTLLGGMTRKYNLTKKLEFLGMTYEGREHRGVDDAKNIARLFIKLMKLGRDGVVPGLVIPES